MNELFILGTGGFGREAADVVIASRQATARGDSWGIAGFYDDGPAERNLVRLKELGIPFLGPMPDRPPYRGAALIVAIGAPEVRRRIVNRAGRQGWTFPSVVHPTATLGSSFSAGEGLVVCGGVQVTTNVSLGSHVHLNASSTIGHDAVLGDFVSVNPAATVSGEVRIGDGCLIGASAVILQNLRVGEAAVVGAAACVVRDVPSATIVKGIPAR